MSEPVTVELLTRLDAAMTQGEWLRGDTKSYLGITLKRVNGIRNSGRICWIEPLSQDAEANIEGIAALRNALPSIIRDLRRLVEVEADNARLNEMAMNYQRLCDERYAKLGRDHDAAQRRLVEAEAELERTRVKLHCYVAAADAEATFANESELQRLRAALKPFADRAESLRQLASDLDSTEARVCGTQPVPVQHLIAAAEALAHREGQ